MREPRSTAQATYLERNQCMLLRKFGEQHEEAMKIVSLVVHQKRLRIRADSLCVGFNQNFAARLSDIGDSAAETIHTNKGSDLVPWKTPANLRIILHSMHASFTSPLLFRAQLLDLFQVFRDAQFRDQFFAKRAVILDGVL